jgi:arylsulfatase A-like enzyme
MVRRPGGRSHGRGRVSTGDLLRAEEKSGEEGNGRTSGSSVTPERRSRHRAAGGGDAPPRRVAGPSIPRAARLAAAVLLPLLIFSCRETALRPDVALLPLAEPVPTTAAAAGAAATREPRRVAIGHSERLALVSSPEGEWRIPVELAEGDRLTWSAAVPRADADDPGSASPPTAGGTLTLSLVGGREVALGRWRLSAADGWRAGALEVPAEAGDGAGVLRLSSDAPFAWAELSLLRRDAAAPPRPNLILVSVDTLRADRLGLYGAERDTSPNLDRFAADALVFDKALSPSTWTLPSHGSLFTGLLPDQHGLIGVGDRLGPTTPTVAERLRRLGYRTVAFTDGGFLGPQWGLSDGFDRYDTTPGHAWTPKDVAVIVAAASRWLEANGHEPWFLFVHTYEVHQPYRNVEGFADPFLPPDADRTTPVVAFRLAAFPADPEQAERALAFYDGGVARMDHHLGGWLEALRAGGGLDDTAVILTSDHGEELGDHGAYEHALGRLYDENVRVPLLVRPPGGPPGGGRRETVPASGLDVAPTLLAWAGAADAALPGRPLLELAQTGTAARPVLVHGSASLPEQLERRYRLDEGSDSVVFDRKRSVVLHFDRAADPGMRRAGRLWGPELNPPGADLPEPPRGKPRAMLARLQAVQAWLEGAGLAVRLPAAAAAVQVRKDSALVPLGVWDGAAWRPLHADHRRAVTAPGWPAVLRFELAPGRRPRSVWLEEMPVEEGSGRPPWAPLELPLVGARDLLAPGWNPIDGRLPAPGEIFGPAAKSETGRIELDERAREELRALGYLR